MSSIRWLCALAPVFLSACASLQGIPVGLSETSYSALASNDLQRVLGVTLDLKKAYDGARNDNLKYIYWSSVPFFPLGAAAAGDIYAKRTSALAGVGIIAGTLAAFNSFTNARPNANAYLSGSEALVCLYTKLAGYTSRSGDVQVLRTGANSIETVHIPAARAALANAQALDMASKAVTAERTSNATIMSSLATAEHQLTQAIQDASQAALGAKAEVALFDHLPNFVTGGVIQIDSKVARKITLTDVSYASLVTSISAATSAPTPAPAAAAAAPKPPAKPAAKPAAKAVPQTPVADAVRALQAAGMQLRQAASSLQEATSKFGLSAREQEVDTCVKNL